MKPAVISHSLISVPWEAQQVFDRIPRLLAYAQHQLYSIWLFTFSDLKTIVGPKAFFGTVNALSTVAFEMDSRPLPGDLEILSRLPRVVFWIWINLLPFAIDNQRQPEAILEDSANKPWRPMPSKRVHPDQARAWMLCLYPAAVLASSSLGGLRQCLMLIFLGVWYNDFGGADANCLVRNFINACGFACYASGAMEVALGVPLPVSPLIVAWFATIAAVVLTSVHSQDMADQEGDALRGRLSVPLTIGDAPSRWTIAASVLFFSCYCPGFWGLSWMGYLWPCSLGVLVSLRSITLRTVRQDKTTFCLWNLWMVAIYCLPLIRRHSRSLAPAWLSQVS